MTLKTRNENERRARIGSPRLAALARALRQGDEAALEDFWREVSERGTPLIEPADGTRAFSLVTFLWKACRPVHEVLLLSSICDNLDGDRMAHLRGSNLWYKTYRVPNDLRATYRFQVDSVICIDRLNQRTSLVPGDRVSPFGATARFSLLYLPDATPLPWAQPYSGRPFGQVSQHAFHSSQSGNMYRLWIYTPPSYTRAAEPYNLLLLFDGWAYARVLQAPTILDNLQDVGALPPLVAVMLGHPDRQTRESEYTFHQPFLEFVTQELLPWIRLHYHITADPALSVVGGLDISAVSAALLALRHPDLFGNVLAQSGHFEGKLPEDTEHERVANLVASNPTAPVRFHLDAGLLETHPTRGGGPSLLISNRHLRQLLQAKNYRVHYEEFSGGHDYICWQETFIDGLLALFKGFGTG
ncbi:MAG TPA: alpha/beta hydrolase-fold protein [Ktedonobacteraceae bacterium]